MQIRKNYLIFPGKDGKIETWIHSELDPVSLDEAVSLLMEVESESQEKDLTPLTIKEDLPKLCCSLQFTSSLPSSG
jgi:hypothetical protein